MNQNLKSSVVGVRLAAASFAFLLAAPASPEEARFRPEDCFPADPRGSGP